MKKVLSEIWQSTTSAQKKFFYLLVILMFLAANLELLGIGMILPVVALLINPELMQQNYYLGLIRHAFPTMSNQIFLLFLCGIITVIYVGKNIFLTFLTWFQYELIRRKASDLTKALFHQYIYAPYSVHLTRNSGDLLANLNMMEGSTRTIINSFLMTLIELINIFMIFALLFFFVPLATLMIVFISLLFSLMIYLPLRKSNNYWCSEFRIVNSEINRNRLESFHGFKEIRIHGAENFFAKMDEEKVNRLGKITCRLNLLSQLPRFLLETGMIAGGMFLLVLYLLSGTAATSIILKFSLIGTAIVRLMPSLSRIQYQLVTLKSNAAFVRNCFEDLNNIPEENEDNTAQPIQFEKNIKITDLSFQYDQAKSPVLQHLNLTIPVNSSAAFIGQTGCGKTTLVDIIAGLLEPTSGKVTVDDRDIRDNIRSWRSMIGYVPQFIYILDDTVLANITLGLPPEKINVQQAEECLKMAQLYDFVQTLPQGIHTKLGECGSRLSGGQRQRLGIARALYSHPRVLILDEATSALDTETEKSFMDAVELLQGKMTILIIAHRLETTRGCTQIFDIHKMKEEK